MKTLVIVILSAVLAGALGAIVAVELGREADEVGLDLGVDERLDALRGRLEVVEKEAEDARRERAETRARAGAGPVGASAADLAALRGDLERLRAELGGRAPVAAGDAAEPEDEIAELIDQRLRQLQEEQRKLVRERQEKQAAKTVDDEVRKRIQGYRKRLQLAPDQAERLEISYQEAVEVALPLYGTLKNEQAGNDDRLAAINRLRSNRREFDESARSIMSAPQYESFLELRAKEDQAIDRWLDETEAGIRGVSPPAR